MGTVWKAWQSDAERWVAVKMLKGTTGEMQRKRFALEGRALGRLNHPNCLNMHEFGYSEDHAAYYLVMEYLEGITLGAWMERRLPIADIIEITSQVSTALAYAHHQGVVHRDLKPENVMLVDVGHGRKLVKVLDFGLARLTGDDDQRMTKTGEIFGTPVYMSPEQVRGSRNAGPKSDIYSLGIMLYEMLEKRLPFDCESSFDFLMAHVSQPVPPVARTDAPPALREVVARCVSKEPEDRPDAFTLWGELRAVLVEPEEDSTMFIVVEKDLKRTLQGIGPVQAGVESSGELPTLADREPVTTDLQQIIDSTGNFELVFDHGPAMPPGTHDSDQYPPTDPEHDAPLELDRSVLVPTRVPAAHVPTQTMAARSRPTPEQPNDERASPGFVLAVVAALVLAIVLFVRFALPDMWQELVGGPTEAGVPEVVKAPPAVSPAIALPEPSQPATSGAAESDDSAEASRTSASENTAEDKSATRQPQKRAGQNGSPDAAAASTAGVTVDRGDDDEPFRPRDRVEAIVDKKTRDIRERQKKVKKAREKFEEYRDEQFGRPVE